MSERVLVVDDERDACRLISFNLEQAGFDTECAMTAGDALLAAARQRPAVVVLDVMLPDLSGVEVCRRLRGDRVLADVGILMLTAVGDDESRIAGFEAGADDYVVKPYNVREVVLRVTALARRIGERPTQAAEERSDQAAPGPYWSGPLMLDPVTHDVRASGQAITLRPLEFKLLATLMAEPGRVFTRDELIHRVWEMDFMGNPRTVDVHVRRLRMSLGACAEQIETVPGFGYRARAS